MRLLETDVAVIGGGAAGLSALRPLCRGGKDCVLLEAQSRVGGRIRTVRRPGWRFPIELGAEFVHGHPSPTLSLGGGTLSLSLLPERHLFFREDGARAEGREVANPWASFAKIVGPARQAGGELSMLDFLRDQDLAEDDVELVRLMVEGYHAAPLADASARAVADDAATAGDEFQQFRVSNGYDRVVMELEHEVVASGARMELGARAMHIEWRKGRVVVIAAADEGDIAIRARQAIVTVPVGVLRAEPAHGGIEFEPRPAVLDRRLDGLAMGHVVKLVLRFARPPWNSQGSISDSTFVHISGAPFRTFWRQRDDDQEQLTAWAGGPSAVRLSELEVPQLVTLALTEWSNTVRADFTASRRALLEVHYHDFSRDPASRGAYSYVRPHGVDAARLLSRPIEGTLFFAGEALDIEYPATVAGAIASGTRAARRALVARAPASSK